MEPRHFLSALFQTAVQAALPKPEWYSGLEHPKGRTIVIGAGKAAASMAQAFEKFWDGNLEGLVVTTYGHSVPTKRVEVVEAAHPIPDAAGPAAAKRILGKVQDLGPEDLVVALISGGGSSLLTLPAEGITLAEKQSVVRDLLASGATIREINAVRKALSGIKGGRLLAACKPARVVTYIISDVPGDDPSIVASGPTIPDRTPPGEALEVLKKYKIEAPDSVLQLFSENTARQIGSLERRDEIYIAASAQISLEAAAQAALAHGVTPHILSDSIEGESREVAKVHAALARQIAERGQPVKPPCVLLSGGETTVTVRGLGRGGRNVEFLASLAQSLDARPNIFALAADTDGIDGSDPVAGAFLDPTTIARAGPNLTRALSENNAHALFEELKDQLITGPTLTNVNDFRAILIYS